MLTFTYLSICGVLFSLVRLYVHAISPSLSSKLFISILFSSTIRQVVTKKKTFFFHAGNANRFLSVSYSHKVMYCFNSGCARFTCSTQSYRSRKLFWRVRYKSLRCFGMPTEKEVATATATAAVAVPLTGLIAKKTRKYMISFSV